MSASSSWTIAAVAMCVGCSSPSAWPPDPPPPIIYRLPFKAPQVRSAGATREGSAFGIYTLGRGTDGSAEIVRYTWTPEAGILDEGRLVDSLRAMYLGDIVDYRVATGLVIDGLGDSREINDRYILDGKLVPFYSGQTYYQCGMGRQDGQWATIDSSEQWFVASGYCGRLPLPCLAAMWSSLLSDGGVYCDINDGQPPFHRRLHPGLRAAGLGSRDFVTWNRDGQIVLAITDAGVAPDALFWPSAIGGLRRIGVIVKYFPQERYATSELREWSFENGGVVARESHLSRHFGRIGAFWKSGDYVIVNGDRPANSNVITNRIDQVNRVEFAAVFRDGSDSAVQYHQNIPRHEYKGRFFSGVIGTADGGYEIQEYPPEPVVEYPFTTTIEFQP